MKECLRGFDLVMKSTQRVPGDRPLMTIVYKYISKKVFGFTSKEGSRSTELGVTYLYLYPENYSSVSI